MTFRRCAMLKLRLEGPAKCLVRVGHYDGAQGVYPTDLGRSVG